MPKPGRPQPASLIRRSLAGLLTAGAVRRGHKTGTCCWIARPVQAGGWIPIVWDANDRRPFRLLRPLGRVRDFEPNDRDLLCCVIQFSIINIQRQTEGERRENQPRRRNSLLSPFKCARPDELSASAIRAIRPAKGIDGP